MELNEYSDWGEYGRRLRDVERFKLEYKFWIYIYTSLRKKAASGEPIDCVADLGHRIAKTARTIMAMERTLEERFIEEQDHIYSLSESR